jgi:hypothetical protein
MSCRVFERIKTLYLHLSRIITAEKGHKGVYLHACGVAYRWQPESGQLYANYCHYGAREPSNI